MTSPYSFLNEPHPTSADGEQRTDFRQLATRATATPLSPLGILQVSGPDTDKLLQGQLTCDINLLTPGASLPGALCEIKGRMITSFTGLRPQGDTVLLVMARELVAITLETLKKYAAFYKAKLAEVTSEYCIFGLNNIPPDSLGAASQGGLVAAVSPARQLLLCPAAEGESCWRQLTAVAEPATTAFWDYLAIAEGLGEVRSETSGEFIPQMLNFQHTGAVSFRKGCYTGQEIVARMQYLGKLKRRLYHLRATAAAAPPPGTEIRLGDTGVGTLVLACMADTSTLEMLAVLTAEGAAADRLAIGGTELGIETIPLPYQDKLSEGSS